jgi:nucleoside-triphosphatase
VNQPDGPRVGKYRVNLHDLESIGVGAILRAAEECDVICVDEIGPMELFSERFKGAVQQVVECEKPLVGIVHWKAKDRLIEEVRRREDAEIIEVTLENRDRLQETIVTKTVEFLKSQ